MNKFWIYMSLTSLFGGMMFSSLFITHSTSWQTAIAPFSVGVFGLIFDRK